jgi:hypothetical protein
MSLVKSSRLIVTISLLIGVFLIVSGVGSAKAEELKVMKGPQGKIVYDAKSGLYWIGDLSSFDNMSYDEQKAAIDKLTGGKWRMATKEDMKTLSSYNEIKLHTAFDSGKTTQLGGQKLAVYNGRIDCKECGDGYHTVANMTYDVNAKKAYSPFRYEGMSISDGRFKGIGAWVVTKDFAQKESKATK